MKANLMNGTIEMTKEEAKSAGKLNSDKFMELKEARDYLIEYIDDVNVLAKKYFYNEG